MANFVLKVLIVVLKFLIVLYLYRGLILQAKAEYIVAWRVWKMTGTVCGNPVQNIPESLESETENYRNETFDNHAKLKNRIVVQYDNFRCCMKKTWVTELSFDPVQKACMRNLMMCLLEAEKKPCTMERSDYMLLIFSDNGIVVLISFTVMVVITTGFVLRQMHKNYY